MAHEIRNLLRVQGASAVLIYGAVDAPLAQPRMLVWGHFIGALIGALASGRTNANAIFGAFTGRRSS